MLPTETSLKRTAADPSMDQLINCCKGIAILLVVLYHAKVLWMGWQGVHLFIFFSGFLLSYSRLTQKKEEHWSGWWGRRIKKILPTYWLVCGIGLVVMMALYVAGLNNPVVSMTDILQQFLMDVLLLRNITYQGMFGYPNSALWFVPFILGFYLIFPMLFRYMDRQKTTGRILRMVLLFAFIECVYRFVSIYFLDGIPVGFGRGVFSFFGKAPQAMDHLRDGFPFQKWAPFGWFPSRIGEFVAGMAAAFLMVRSKKNVQALLTPKSLGIGFLSWFLGCALVSWGYWGWIAADFFICLGIVPLVAHLSRALWRAWSRMSLMEKLGKQSYYLYLVHMPVMYLFSCLSPVFINSVPLIVLFVVLALTGLVFATRMIAAFDRHPITGRAAALVFRKKNLHTST